jgi:hypothetical protein
MRTLIQPPTRTGSDWEPSGTFDAVDLEALGDCLGYRVDDPDGRIGTVEGIVSGTWTDRPEAIEIRVGLFRPAILMAPVDAVASVHRARRRLILRDSVDLADAYIP